jgi:hypothetical protein
MRSWLPYLVAALPAAFYAPTVFAQGLLQEGAPRSVIRTDALSNIPQHIPEIGWDTDVPSLFVIRFEPEKMSFPSGWSSWVTEAMLKRTGVVKGAAVDPWPSIFASNASIGAIASGQLSPDDMQKFQAWCLRRSQAIPPIIVQSTPFVAPLGGGPAEVLPLGLRRGQPKESQGVMGMGFAEMVGLTLTRNADDDAATIPPDVLAALPPAGVTLETRLRWRDPVPAAPSPDNPMAMPVGLKVPGDLVSLRVVSNRRVLWERRYDGTAPPPRRAPSRMPKPLPTPRPTSNSDELPSRQRIATKVRT